MSWLWREWVGFVELALWAIPLAAGLGIVSWGTKERAAADREASHLPTEAYREYRIRRHIGRAARIVLAIAVSLAIGVAMAQLLKPR